MKIFNLRRDLYPIIILIIGSLVISFSLGRLALTNILTGIAIYMGFYLITLIDPLKDNYLRFFNTTRLIRDILITFYMIFNLIPILSAQGYIAKTNKTIMILISLLMIILGNYFPTFKRNWFFGIKTPWTMSNEDVWNQTHRFAGKLFVIAGVISFIGIILTNSTYFLFVTFMIAALWTGLYSFWVYQKLSKTQPNKVAITRPPKKFTIIIILCMIIIPIIIITPFIKSALGLPIPDSINQIEAFILQQPGYNLNSDFETHYAAMEETNLQNIRSAQIIIDGSSVMLTVAQFVDSSKAKEFFLTNKILKQGQLQIGLVEINIPGYVSYWSATINGEKNICWQRKDWSILIKGDNAEAVKKINLDFQNYIKQ